MIPGIDPKVDYAFKHVFGKESHEAILIDLIDAVRLRRPGTATRGLQILNPFNDKESLDDKLSILDIKARDAEGKQFNVEMQMVAPVFLPERLIYYLAKFHQQQLRQGQDYDELRPTLLICFVNDVVFAEIAEDVLEFELLNRRHGLVLTDHLSLWMIELPKFTKTLEQLSGPLDHWLYFLRHATELDAANLPAPLDQNPLIRQAMEDLVTLSRTDLERERYESRLKAQRDESTLRNWAARQHQEGLREGIKIGLEHKFGSEGLLLMPAVREIKEMALLQSILKAVLTVESLDEVRALIE